MTIGERIKSKREIIGYSQVELAKRIGVSKQTLYKYENGIITNIPSDKIELLANALDTTPGYLMGWDDSVQTSGQQIVYYEDPEQARQAQEMFEDRDMRMLFDMKKRMTPERFERQMENFRDMYRLEHPEEFPEDWID